MKLSVSQDKCKGCGLCISACPRKLLTRSNEINSLGVRYPVLTDETACISCASCALTCPDMCISIYKEV